MTTQDITSGVPAVMGSFRLDAAALWALVDDLARLQLQAVQVLFSGVALGDCSLQRTRGVIVVGLRERHDVVVSQHMWLSYGTK